MNPIPSAAGPRINITIPRDRRQIQREKTSHRSGSRGNLKKETLRWSELCLQSAAAQQSGILDLNCAPVQSKEQSVHGPDINPNLARCKSANVTAEVRARGSITAFKAKASFPCCDARACVCVCERFYSEIVAELLYPSRK